MRENRPLILVVEDDLLIALEMRSLVTSCDCALAGPVATVAEALNLVDSEDLDGAFLDINLGGDRVWAVADALAARAIPYILVSGYSEPDLPARFRDRPYIAKPISLSLLRRGITALGLDGLMPAVRQ